MEYAILSYDLYNNELKEMDFKLNPYGRSVANKMINWEQCTLWWHVDSNKISHLESKVNEEIMAAV